MSQENQDSTPTTETEAETKGDETAKGSESDAGVHFMSPNSDDLSPPNTATTTSSVPRISARMSDYRARSATIATPLVDTPTGGRRPRSSSRLRRRTSKTRRSRGASIRESMNDFDLEKLMNDPQMQEMFEMMKTAINGQDAKIEQLEYQLEEAKIQNEQLQSEYELKLDESDMKIKQVEYEIEVYKSEAHKLQSRINEIESKEMEYQATQDINETTSKQLEQIELHARDLQQDNENLNTQIAKLRELLNTQNATLQKQQKSIFELTKIKTECEQEMEKMADEFDAEMNEAEEIIIALETRVNEFGSMNHELNERLQKAEMEKYQMHSDIANNALEMLQQEANDEVAGLAAERKKPVMRYSSGPIAARMRSTSQANHDPAKVSRFAQHRQNLSQSSVIEEDSLLHEFNHGRSDSVYSDIGEQFIRRSHSRHGSRGSRGAFSTEFLKEMQENHRNELEERLQGLLAELVQNELPNKLRGAIQEEMKAVNDMGERIHAMMEQSRAAVGKENMQEMFNELSTGIETSIENTIGALASKEEDNTAMAELVQKSLGDLSEKMSSSVKPEELAQALRSEIQETIASQIGFMQVALENVVGQTVRNMPDALPQAEVPQIDTAVLETNLRDAIGEEIDEQMKKVSDDFHSKFGQEMNSQLGHTLDSAMKDKLDDFMSGFRKEVVPELQALFEQLSHTLKNHQRVADSGDEYKYNESEGDLRAQLAHLKDEMKVLEEENDYLKDSVKEATASKVRGMVKLQNIIDHLRYDVETLEARLESMTEQMQHMERQGAGNVRSMVGTLLGGMQQTWENAIGSQRVST